MIHPSKKTTIDVTSRQTSKFYVQANLLVRNVRHCTDQVQCALFKTNCANIYICVINFTVIALIVFYVVFLGSVGGMVLVFFSRVIPAFAELLISATLLPLRSL